MKSKKRFSVPARWKCIDMSRGRQDIEFEGLFSESVLGIFRIIRGFADLRDLAAVSVPYKKEVA